MAKIGINLATGGLEQEDIIVGIDLGTTNSLVAIVHPESGQPVALKETDGFSLVPSVIYFDEYDMAVVGNHAVEKMALRPARTIYSAKRLMGKSYKDLDKERTGLAYKILEDDTDALVKVQVGNRFYTPVELSSFLLAELKKRAEHILKRSVSKAVITVPAYFNDVQRQATRDAGKLAGFDVLRIINEPTAASLAYGMGLKNEEEHTIAVYDFGGGTFDVSILRIHDGLFEVLATHGDTLLGGDDLDYAVVLHWFKQMGKQPEALQQDKVLMQQLRLLAEKAKKYLSAHNEFSTQWEGHTLSLSKSDFDALIRPIIQRTIHSCAQALKDSGLNKENIDAVVLVGGSTRVPLVKEMVKEFFDKELFDTLNPDEVVAQGAAVQADILAGKNTDVLLLDVTPLSLGLETMGGLMDVLIPRNSKIPTKAGRQYTTQKDGQVSMRISVYQGERDLVKDNRKLAEFHLTNIPAMPAGMPKVEVNFLLDADGILRVSATELRSGVAQSVEVKPQYGLTDEEVEKMLMDSLVNAQQDVKDRALAEATTEAEQMIETTQRFLQKYKNELNPEELEETQKYMDALQDALRQRDKDLIQGRTEELNEVSRPFAERVMEQALKQAMRGKQI